MHVQNKQFGDVFLQIVVLLEGVLHFLSISNNPPRSLHHENNTRIQVNVLLYECKLKYTYDNKCAGMVSVA